MMVFSTCLQPNRLMILDVSDPHFFWVWSLILFHSSPLAVPAPASFVACSPRRCFGDSAGNACGALLRGTAQARCRGVWWSCWLVDVFVEEFLFKTSRNSRYISVYVYIYIIIYIHVSILASHTHIYHYISEYDIMYICTYVYIYTYTR